MIEVHNCLDGKVKTMDLNLLAAKWVPKPKQNGVNKWKAFWHIIYALIDEFLLHFYLFSHCLYTILHLIIIYY